MKRFLMLTTFFIILGMLSMNALAQKPGEIVFSKTLIDPRNPAALTAQFQSGDPVYAVAFLEKSISDSVGSMKNVDVEVFLYELKPAQYSYQQPSEVQLDSNALRVSGAALQRKYLPLDIVPVANAMTAYGNPDLVYQKFGSEFYGPVKYAAVLSNLDPGEHTIIVKLSCNYQFVSAGKFVIKGGDYALYKKVSRDLNASASGVSVKTALMPKAARSDKGLESDMINALKSSQTYRERIKGEVLRVVIIDPDWMTSRNEITGVILHRYIRAAIAVKNGDGACTVWPIVTFQQDYAGNNFQKTKFDGVGDPYRIPCENVWK